jgi:hypothetical protein
MSMLLTVQVTEEEGGVTLYCPELDLVTCSSTLGKARENFAALVEEYYLYLIDNEGQLDAESRAHLNLYRALKMEGKEIKPPDKGVRLLLPTILTLFFVERAPEELSLAVTSA